MAVIYAQLILKKLRTLKQVPAIFREQTKEILLALDLPADIEAQLTEE